MVARVFICPTDRLALAFKKLDPKHMQANSPFPYTTLHCGIFVHRDFSFLIECAVATSSISKKILGQHVFFCFSLNYFAFMNFGPSRPRVQFRALVIHLGMIIMELRTDLEDARPLQSILYTNLTFFTINEPCFARPRIRTAGPGERPEQTL